MTGDEITHWQDRMNAVLHESNWAEALTIDNFDVLEALRIPIWQALLSLQRKTSQCTTEKCFYSALSRSIGSRFARFIQIRHANRLTTAPYKCQILFWPREPTHIDVQVPVARALQELNVTVGFISNSSQAINQLAHEGFKAVYAYKAWTSSVKNTKKVAKTCLSILNSNPGKKFPALSAIEDPQTVVNCLRRLLGRLIPYVLDNLVFAEKILTDISPSVLVVGNDLTFEGRVACLKTKNTNIKTVSIMHGAVSGNPLQRYHVADQIFTFGEQSKLELLKWGMDHSHVVVTGAPHLDTIYAKPRPKMNIKKILGIEADKPIVLIATSGPGHSVSLPHHLKLIECLVQISAQRSDFYFLAKLHRKDRPDYYKKIMAKVPGARMKVIPYNNELTNDIFNWLPSSSVVITGASSAAIDAMVTGIPVISIDFARELNGIDFIERGATLHVTDPLKLAEEISTVIQKGYPPELKDKVIKFLSEYFHLENDQAARRAAQAICALDNKLPVGTENLLG